MRIDKKFAFSAMNLHHIIPSQTYYCFCSHQNLQVTDSIKALMPKKPRKSQIIFWRSLNILRKCNIQYTSTCKMQKNRLKYLILQSTTHITLQCNTCTTIQNNTLLNNRLRLNENITVKNNPEVIIENILFFRMADSKVPYF